VPTVGGTMPLLQPSLVANSGSHPEASGADVFLCVITDWKQLNALPEKITVVHRSDGLRYHLAFTNSLSTFSPDLESKVVRGRQYNWPLAWRQRPRRSVRCVQKRRARSGYLNPGFS